MHWGTKETNERIKSEQPDHKHAFVMKDGGTKRMNQTRKIDTELLREQRDTLLEIAQAGFASRVVDHLDGILNFIDDTLDTVEEHGSMTLEMGGE